MEELLKLEFMDKPNEQFLKVILQALLSHEPTLYTLSEEVEGSPLDQALIKFAKQLVREDVNQEEILASYHQFYEKLVRLDNNLKAYKGTPLLAFETLMKRCENKAVLNIFNSNIIKRSSCIACQNEVEISANYKFFFASPGSKPLSAQLNNNYVELRNDSQCSKCNYDKKVTKSVLEKSPLRLVILVRNTGKKQLSFEEKITVQGDQYELQSVIEKRGKDYGLMMKLKDNWILANSQQYASIDKNKVFEGLPCMMLFTQVESTNSPNENKAKKSAEKAKKSAEKSKKSDTEKSDAKKSKKKTSEEKSLKDEVAAQKEELSALKEELAAFKAATTKKDEVAAQKEELSALKEELAAFKAATTKKAAAAKPMGELSGSEKSKARKKLLKRRKKTKAAILRGLKKAAPTPPKSFNDDDTFEIHGGWSEEERMNKKTKITGEPIGKLYGLTAKQAKSTHFRVQIKFKRMQPLGTWKEFKKFREEYSKRNEKS